MADDEGPAGPIRQKLVESKEKWAREGRLLTGGTESRQRRRLPPGQREVKNWPVLDLGVHPNVPAKEWEMKVGGLVENPVTWRWDDLMAQPAFSHTSDIHCVTACSRYDNRWGRRLRPQLRRWCGEARGEVHRLQDYTRRPACAVAFDDDDVMLHR